MSWFRSRRAIGNNARTERRSKNIWQRPTLESIWADIRFALRQMRHAPAFTFTVVLLLGLGIGSVAAVFSIVDAILLRPVPYPDPSSLVIPWDIPPAGVDVGGYQEFPWGPIQFHALEQETKIYRYVGAFQGSSSIICFTFQITLWR